MRLVGVLGVAHPAPLRAALLRQGAVHLQHIENVDTYMTGLLHEGIFHVGGLIKPAIFGSLPWAYVMCNWAEILICGRH